MSISRPACMPQLPVAWHPMPHGARRIELPVHRFRHLLTPSLPPLYEFNHFEQILNEAQVHSKNE